MIPCNSLELFYTRISILIGTFTTWTFFLCVFHVKLFLFWYFQFLLHQWTFIYTEFRKNLKDYKIYILVECANESSKRQKKQILAKHNKPHRATLSACYRLMVFVISLFQIISVLKRLMNFVYNPLSFKRKIGIYF